MRITHEDCQRLFVAAQELVNISGLAHYTGSGFVACDNVARFEAHWKQKFHHRFGRYMAWVLFSVVAENASQGSICEAN